MLVHEHRATSDGQRRIKWQPIFHEGGTEGFGTGSTASQEKFEVKNIMKRVQLHDGALGHAQARKLDHRKFTCNDDVVDVTAGGTAVEKPATSEVLQDYLHSSASQAPTHEGASKSVHLDPWKASVLELKPVDVFEIGYGELIIRVH